MADTNRLKTVLAVLGSAIGLIGISITIISFLRDKPNLEIHIESVGLPFVGPDEVRAKLRQVEAEAGKITGSLVDDLLKEAEAVSDWTDASEVRDYGAAIQRRIDQLDAGRYWGPEDIEVDGTAIKWPDTSSVDVMNPSGAASFPEDLVAGLKGGHPTGQQIAEIKERAHRMHPGIQTDEEKERAGKAAHGLRELRIRLDEMTDEKRRRLIARITVRNKSALPTYIVSGAALTIAQPSGEPRTIDLYLVEDGLLERYSVRALTLESRALASLDQIDRTVIMDALSSVDGSPAVIQLADLHDEYWPGLGSIRQRPQTPKHDEFHRLGKEILAKVSP